MIIISPRSKNFLKNPADSDAGMFTLHTNEQLVKVSTFKDEFRDYLLSSFRVAGKYFIISFFLNETHLLVMELTADCMRRV